jgi:alpha-beta hydrolase superfamily lysophospholipase
MPQHYTDTHETPDSVRLFLQGWLPEGAPRAVVFVVHGYAEHSGRYADLAGVLTDAGFAVCTCDQRGFGRSGGRRALVTHIDALLGDLEAVLHGARERVPGVPLVLFGQSMGGLEVVRYAQQKRTPRPDAIVASAPALSLPDPAWLQALSLAVGRIAPRLPTVHLDAGGLSRDDAVEDAVLSDPLFYQGRVAAGTAAALVAGARAARDEAAKLDLPLLFYHGTEDPITEPSGTEAVYGAAQSEDKTLVLLSGLRHEPHNETEPDRTRTFALLTGWLRERFGSE